MVGAVLDAARARQAHPPGSNPLEWMILDRGIPPLPTSALEGSGCHSQSRGEQRGTLPVARESCSTSSRPQAEALTTQRISSA